MDNVKNKASDHLFSLSFSVVRVAFNVAPLLLGLAILLEVLVGLSIPVASVGLGFLTNGLTNGNSMHAGLGILFVSLGVGFQWILGGLGARFRIELMEKTGFYFEKLLVNAVTSLRNLDLFNDSDFLEKLFLARDQVARSGGAVNVLINALSSLARTVLTVGVLIYLDFYWVALVVAAGLMVWSSIKASVIAEQSQIEGGTYHRKARQLVDALMDKDVAAQVRIWNAAGNIEKQVSALHDKNLNILKQGAIQGLKWNLLTTALFMVCFTGLIMVTVSGSNFTAGELVTLVVLGSQLSGILFGLSQTTGVVRGSMDAIRRVYDVESAINSYIQHSVVSEKDTFEEGIKFNQVSFSYQDGSPEPVLKDLNIHLRPGEVVGIVGENGAGKSTFLSLLLGLFSPGQGQLTGLAGKSKTAVMQDFMRPELTVSDSVGLGSIQQTSTTEELNAAFARAGVESIKEKFDEALSTPLGVQWGGIELSGGQWQQLAFARAMMRPEADLIVLDEPTASISPDREYQMLRAIKDVIYDVHEKSRQIAVVVSHRLSVMRSVDRILVFKAGEIVEDGSHDELMTKDKGIYRQQFQQQAAYYA